tara:strand:- start:11148 stop:11339 length:192 start_codon:yes stop_codon:yes gene_type:complete
MKDRINKIDKKYDNYKEDTDWERIQKNPSKFLLEALVFGLGASVFLLIVSYLLWILLKLIYGV